MPSGLFTQSVATVDTLPPFGFSENNVVVQVTLDEQGNVVDYDAAQQRQLQAAE